MHRSRWLSSLLSCLLPLISTGCFSSDRVIRVSATPEPDVGDSILYIATEEPIDVAVGDKVVKKNMAGYYLIHKNEMQLFLDTAQKYHELQIMEPFDCIKVQRLLDH